MHTKQFFYLVIYINFLKYVYLEKVVELNFYRNLLYKNDSDFSELIKNRLYITLEVGSNYRKVDFQLIFHSPYFSVSSQDLDNSTTFRLFQSDFSFYSRTEFNYAQISEEKIKLNDKITINDFKIISDKFGTGKIGLNLNIDNNELLDFNFIKELIRNNLIDNYNIKLLYNKNDYSIGKIIFGSSFNYTRPFHMEKNSIFCFSVDKVIYQEEDYTTEIALDFYSGGIVSPKDFFIQVIEKFFKPYLENYICKRIILYEQYESTFFCNDNFTDIEKFGNIYFTINDFELKKSFVLEGKELFIKINSGYFFLIRRYLYSSINKWVLGSPFFRKYPISFNFQKNLIGFDINNYVDNSDKKTNNGSILPCILLIVIGLILIIFIVVNLYIFLFKKKRKVRANELDEDIIYNKKADEENNLGI